MCHRFRSINWCEYVGIIFDGRPGSSVVGSCYEHSDCAKELVSIIAE